METPPALPISARDRRGSVAVKEPRKSIRVATTSKADKEKEKEKALPPKPVTEADLLAIWDKNKLLEQQVSLSHSVLAAMVWVEWRLLPVQEAQLTEDPALI